MIAALRARFVGVVAAAAVLAAAGLPANGQTPADTPKRVGVLFEGDCKSGPGKALEGLATRLAARGFVQGRNLAFVSRCAQGGPGRFESFARELVAARVDVLMTVGTTKTRALQRATTTIPILAAVGDPVGSGFARTLANPGGNITGLSYGVNEKAQKTLELLRDAVPDLAHVVILYGKSYCSASEVTSHFVREAAAAGVTTRLHLVGSAADVAGALESIASPRRSAAIAFNIFDVDGRTITELALRSGIALMGNSQRSVEDGALMSFELTYENEADRWVEILEKLLRGTPPARIPFELPTRSRLVLNKRTAAALGRPLPPSLLLRADRVIE